MTKFSIEVCFSPKLLPLFDHKNAVVVVIDVLRATSSMCVAFHNGAQSIVPLATVEESLALREKGYLVAAERQAQKVDGVDFGNSPFDFMTPIVKGANIAVTTTNGTQAITAAKDAKKLTIGSFQNLDVLSEWLIKQESDVLCLCSGWKDRFNLEDTLFAGAIVDKLKTHDSFNTNCDSALTAKHLYELAKHDMYGFLENSSHRTRLAHLKLEKEIAYCLTPNQAPVVAVLQGEKLVPISK